MKRTEYSRWRNSNGYAVTVIGTKTDHNQKDWVFTFAGHNPFPFKSCVGSYKILAEWLAANGWVRCPVTSIMHPDCVFINR